MEAVEDSWSYSEILTESVYMLAQSCPTFSHQEKPPHCVYLQCKQLKAVNKAKSTYSHTCNSFNNLQVFICKHLLAVLTKTSSK